MAWDLHLSTPAPRTPPFAASATPERSKIEPQSKFGQNICILRPALTSETIQLFCSFNLVGLLHQCAPLVKWLWHSQSILNWERTTSYSGVCRHDIGQKNTPPRFIPWLGRPNYFCATLHQFFQPPMNSGELRRAKIERQKILETFDDHDQIYGSSFRVCQRMDVEKASLDAVPLTLDTCVEDHFTHEACVKLHFDLIRLTTLEDQAWDLITCYGRKC